jgi:hypothetical protein
LCNSNCNGIVIKKIFLASPSLYTISSKNAITGLLQLVTERLQFYLSIRHGNPS